ncbi:non-ribosomal peptide synthetase [Kitasatospora sp. NPDC057936]|uniref:non-ribosomal peptide synthetase n=1 Tax=Kitasatospora sp. NPDC057936 TaxID=3346283 RepID=UPI0036D7D277
MTSFPSPPWIADRIRARAESADPAVRSRVALRTTGTDTTYAELWERAQKTGAELSALGIGPGDLVGIRLPSGPGVVVAMLASWLAGAAFLPMDAAVPDEYRDRLLSRSGARALVDAEGPHALAGADAGTAAQLNVGRLADRAAYAIYTSGSTGTPKGVLVGQDALAAHAVGVADLLGLQPADTVLQFAGLGFDVAQEEIWPTLAVGGTVAFLDSAARALPSVELASRARELNVSMLQLPTAYWRLLCAEMQGADVSFAGVRTVVIGGESAGTKDVHAHRAGPLGHCTLVNGYGPTETVITCTALVLRPDDPLPTTTGLPIGDPVGDRRLHVLDADRRPADPGAPGELWIGGTPLADGYLDDPSRAAENFRPDPFSAADDDARMYRTGDLVLRHPDGAVEFLGRLDNQVKVRGHRIELDEVDRHLLDTPGVTAAAAVAIDDGTGTGGRTLATVVSVGPDGPTADGIREHLRARLPRHMVPGLILVRDRLPLTPSGKIDRRAVAAAATATTAAGPEPDVVAHTAQASELSLLLDLVRTLLRAPDFGPDDDFLARGGDSLVALRVSGAMKRHGWRLRASDLVAAGSARAVAARMERF